MSASVSASPFCEASPKTTFSANKGLTLTQNSEPRVLFIPHKGFELGLVATLGEITRSVSSPVSAGTADWLFIPANEPAYVAIDRLPDSNLAGTHAAILRCPPLILPAYELLSQGAFAFAAQEFESAYALVSQAAEIFTEQNDVHMAAAAWYKAAQMVYWQEDFIRAQESTNKALQLLADDHTLIPTLRLFSVELKLEQSQSLTQTSDLDVVESSLQYFKKNKDTVGEAFATNLLGQLQRKLGRYEDAVKQFETAASRFDKQNNALRALIARQNAALINLEQRRDVAGATQSYADLIPLLDELLPADTPMYRDLFVSFYRNKALGHQWMGQFQESIAINLDLIERYPNFPRLGRLIQAVGTAYLELGDMGKAADYLEDAWALHAAENDKFSRSGTARALAIIAQQSDRFADADRYLALAIEDATTNRYKMLAQLDRHILRVRAGHLSTLSGMGQLDSQATHDPVVRSRQAHLKALAAANSGASSAEAEFADALALHHASNFDALSFAGLVMDYAAFLAEERGYSRRHELLLDALARFDAYSAQIPLPTLRGHYLAARQELANSLIGSYLQLDPADTDLGALVALESLRARTLKDQRENTALVSEQNPELVRAHSQLASLRLQFQDRDELSKLEARALRSAVSKVSMEEQEVPGLRNDRGLDRDTILSLSASLGEEEVVLNYWLGSNHAAVWIVTHGNIRLVDLGRPEPIVELTQELMKEVRNKPSGNRANLRVRELAVKLGQVLIPPTLILDERTKLQVLADGVLHRLPFSVLATDKFELTDVASIAYKNNLSLSTNSEMSQHREILLLRSELAKLPGVGNEISMIESMAHAAKREVTAIDAVFLRQRSLQGRLIHIGAHGFSDVVVPSRSYLQLGDSSADLLMGYQVANFDLRGSTIILSACDTGVGRMLGREGMLSLAWYFLHGGAEQMVASRWRVSDSATQRFMGQFYASVFERALPIEEALQHARRALRNRAEDRHPYYWAGFSLFR